MEKPNSSFSFDRVPKFITKLYKITSEDRYKGIGWTPDGLRIHVYDRDVFVKETLPLISKTKEFGTFIRMLNSYGFSKSKDIEDEDIYYNRNFRRGREDLLGLNECVKVKQKKCGDLQVKVGDGTMKGIVEYLYAQNRELYTEISACKERIERQERSLNGIVEILSRVFRTNIQEFGMNRGKAGGINRYNDVDMFLDGASDLRRPDDRSIHSEQEGYRRESIPELSFRPSSEELQEEKEDEYDFF